MANKNLPAKFERKDIKIHNDGSIIVDRIGVIGMWWKKYDGTVNLNYGLGNIPGVKVDKEHFKARKEDELITDLLRMLNGEEQK
jgi:hypothetical protein